MDEYFQSGLVMRKEKKTKVQQKSEVSPSEYTETLTDLKKQIQEARLRAINSANNEMIRLYWNMGKTIVQRQENSGWGTRCDRKACEGFTECISRN